MARADMTLADMAQNALRRDPTLPILKFDDRWFTWGQLRALADRVNDLLGACGADETSAVTFIPRNHPHSIATLLGLVAGGHTVRMVYAFQSPEGIAANVARLNSAIVISGERELSEQVRDVLKENGMAAIMLKDMSADLLPGFETAHPERATPAGPEPQIQILTSGTTGPPKQFPVNFSTLAKHHVAPRLAPDKEAEIYEEPPFLIFFPIGNISGIYSTLPTFLRGQRGYLMERYSLAEWRAYIQEFKPVSAGGPPASVQMILDADIPKEELSFVRYFHTGAAPLDPSVQRAFEARYGIPVMLSYGATEFVGPVCAMTPQLHAEWGDKKFASVGRPMPGAKIRVVDPDTFEELPPGQEGLLEVISPRLEPKWIRTSDVGLVDEDGFLFLRGRADGAIMRGGFKLLPETIERALLLHPAVSEAAVVGVPDRRLGQVPAAAIQLKPNVERPTVEELEAHLRKNVLATHIPTQWRFVDDMPKNASMKIDRPGVAALFA